LLLLWARHVLRRIYCVKLIKFCQVYVQISYICSLVQCQLSWLHRKVRSTSLHRT
jgi:hypothetical protein